jgi:excisionase family DNA binding protein
MRPQLTEALSLAKSLPAEELPRFLGELEEIRSTALVRLTMAQAEPRPDENVTVEVAAKRLGVSKSYLYHHHKKFRFARREGGRLLFSSAGLDSYLRRARA